LEKNVTDLYAVFGNPIAQSKSPIIHAEFAKQTGQDLHYTKELIPLDGFSKSIKDFFAQPNGKGLNITVPFKIDAFNLVDELTPRAKIAGAINFIAKQSNGKLLGDNTDGIGMVNDMLNLGWIIKGKRVLILGAGGAVRGVLQPLLDQNPANITIANRTLSKAKELVQHFHSEKIQAAEYSQLAGNQFDLVVNGTSASLHGDLPPLPEKILSNTACCYDMMYGAELTVFLKWAQKNNVAYLADGLGMLVNQAAEAFYLWRGIRPDLKSTINLIRQQLNH
jgi:shikimate dehydrogenase